jgi:anti-sigma factor RsiW
LLTCKQFLQELTDYLDEALDPAVRAELERHVNECPNCWVVCNTTEKTLKVFRGMEAKAVPADIQSRLLSALEKRMTERGPICKEHSAESTSSQKESAQPRPQPPII